MQGVFRQDKHKTLTLDHGHDRASHQETCRGNVHAYQPAESRRCAKPATTTRKMMSLFTSQEITVAAMPASPALKVQLLSGLKSQGRVGLRPKRRCPSSVSSAQTESPVPSNRIHHPPPTPSPDTAGSAASTAPTEIPVTLPELHHVRRTNQGIP